MIGSPATWLSRLQAACEEAAVSTWRRREVALATIAAVGVTLSFPALALVVLSWTAGFFSRLAEEDRVRVFLARQAVPGEVTGLLELLESRDGVADLEQVQPEEARRRFQARFPELAGLAEGLSPEDLRFPASVEFRPPPGIEDARRLVEELVFLPGVDEVRWDADWAQRLVRLRRACRAAALGVGLLALLVAGFGIGNVVGLGALSRREELSIMRLVGAPRFHVRAPFWIEGLVHGALGGLFAAGLAAALISVLAPRAGAFLPTATVGLPRGVLALLVAAPALAGALGAAVAVESVLRRHARLER